MNHHLTQQDADWIANQGEFAITDWHGDARKGRVVSAGDLSLTGTAKDITTSA